jgi:hypothetical protein
MQCIAKNSLFHIQEKVMRKIFTKTKNEFLHKKSFFATLLLALIVAFTCTLLVACSPESTTPTTEGTNTTVSTFFSFTVEESVITSAGKSTENLFIEDYMDILVANQKMTYTSTTGSYGAYIQSINGLTPTGYGYWELLTTDATYQTNDEYTNTITFNGLTFKTSNLGSSSLPAVVNQSYAWYYVA